ncbi:MAG: polysaccharide biosynthesis tyrosine autokinase [Phycisphaerae bacterium]
MSTASNQPPLLGSGAISPSHGFEVGLPAPQQPAHPSESEGLNLGDFVRIIKQRKLMILIVSLLTYGLVGAATYITNRFFAQYTSEALFELNPPTRGGLAPEEMEMTPDAMNNLLQTEASKLRARKLLDEVVAQPEIRTTGYVSYWGGDLAKAARELGDDLRVGPVQGTRLIKVSFSTYKREEARDIVSAIANRFQTKFTDDSGNELYQRLESLKSARSSLQSQLEAKREQIRKFREGRSQPSMESEREAATLYIAQMRQDAAVVDQQIAALEAQLNSLSNAPAGQSPLTAEQRLIVESDPILRYYRSQVENIEVELTVALGRLGEEHRDIRQLRTRRAEFYEKEIAKREELTTQVRQRQIENLRDDLSRTRASQARLLENLQQQESSLRDVDSGIQFNNQLEDEKHVLEGQIASVENELTAAQYRYESRAIMNRLALVQPPNLAVEPSFPKLIVFLGGGAFFAIMVGFGSAFLRELSDTAVRTPVDVARFSRLSVLGSIPALDYEEAEIEQMEHAVRTAPHSLVAEAFRQVRTNLQFSGPASQQKVLLITSPGPEDGKTAVAINLATTMANTGQRVLLVDCNFRRPGLRALFKGSRPEGLSNVLTGQAKFEDLITQTDSPGVSLLTSGPMPPRPAELLGSQAMRDLLQKAAGSYHRVILDAPPTLLISDALLLATMVDGVILVARAGRNSRGVLKRAREQLQAVNAHIFGAVLNGVKARAGGYFKQQYREFYEYRSDETVPSELLPPTTGEATDKPT